MDFVEELMEYNSFEELLEAEKAKMNIFQRCIYHAQNHMILVVFFSIFIGYLVGVFTDESWIFSLLNTLNIQ